MVGAGFYAARSFATATLAVGGYRRRRLGAAALPRASHHWPDSIRTASQQHGRLLRGDQPRVANVAAGSAVICRAVGELSFDLTGTMFEAGRLVRASYSHHGHRQCQLYPDTGRWRRGGVRARATAMCPRP